MAFVTARKNTSGWANYTWAWGFHATLWNCARWFIPGGLTLRYFLIPGAFSHSSFLSLCLWSSPGVELGYPDLSVLSNQEFRWTCLSMVFQGQPPEGMSVSLVSWECHSQMWQIGCPFLLSVSTATEMRESHWDIRLQSWLVGSRGD